MAQHTDISRKLALRQRVLTSFGQNSGLKTYVPFFGDGDIAAECYRNFDVLGVELDPERVKKASSRLPQFRIVEGDADTFTPLAGISIADFDAWINPWKAIVNCAKNKIFSDRFAIFITDGHRQLIRIKKKVVQLPHGKLIAGAWRKQFNTYWIGSIKPFLLSLFSDYVIEMENFYVNNNMLNIGVIFTRGSVSSASPADSIKEALKQSALSGNVPALLQYIKLYPEDGVKAQSVGRPKREITQNEREIYLSIRRSGQTEERAIELTGIAKLLWQNLRAEDATFKESCKDLHRSISPEIPKEVNLDRELLGVRVEVFFALRDEMRNGKGIARINAAEALRKWSAEIDDDPEPYEIADAHPEKVISINEGLPANAQAEIDAV